MNKYQLLIKKIHAWQKDYPYYASSNFTQSEIELIMDALETLQFLEIIFKTKKEKLENHG